MSHQDTKRIAKNTIFLYVRMINYHVNYIVHFQSYFKCPGSGGLWGDTI